MLTKNLIARLIACAFLCSSAYAEPEKPASNSIPVDDIRLFSDVFHQIKKSYVTNVSDKQLMEYAIRGMLNNLDPHSTYLDAASFAELQQSTSGEFAGIGIELSNENGFFKIVTPIDNSPADRAGIKAGDIIIKIDGSALKGLTMDEVTELIRGEIGSKLTLTIVRENQAAPLDLVVTRETIKIKSVKSRIIDKQWGYIRISQFQETTGEETKKHLLKLLDDSFNQLQGLVIDLRNNPGGILDSAVDVADLFISNGLIVYTKGRTPESKEMYYAKPNAYFNNKPIIVLINSGSASASEIVAGALQDHKRAVIAGTSSFGKGSVQIILELPEKRGMKITISRYYTPLGRSIQAQGIKPDIDIQNGEFLTQPDENALALKEANLTKHLANTESESEVKTAEPITNNEKDYVLDEALKLLKVMQLTKKMP